MRRSSRFLSSTTCLKTAFSSRQISCMELPSRKERIFRCMNLMSEFVGQSKLLGTLPVIYNVANLPKPAPGEPALISFDDVTTMFHEFGHGLHGMFSDARYPTLAGTSTARD